MVRVHKRASKRVGTKQRSKITKKVREHHRKSKKLAKKDPTWKSKKKVDPGIPNSYPYKEQLLNEIEQKRIAAEAARREARDLLKKRNVDMDEEEEEMMGALGNDHIEGKEDNKEFSTSALAVPHQYRGTLSAFLELDNRITTLLLLDARDPASWRLEEIERRIVALNESLTFVLTKCDLVPIEVVAAWSAQISSLGLGQVFPISSGEVAKNGRKVSMKGGISNLVAYLENLSSSSDSNEKSRDKSQKVAIVGIENSGKTTLAKKLAATLPHLKILDTPAIVAASSRLAHPEEREEEDDDNDYDHEPLTQSRDQEAAHRILIRNSGSIYKVREPLPLIDALMKRVSQISDLMVTFNVAAFSNVDEFLIGVARTQGRLKKGAIPDTTAACRHILRGWSDGEIGYYSKPRSDAIGLEDAKKAIENDVSLQNVCLHRREWRQKWSGKEIRLTTGNIGMFGTSKIAFSKPEDLEEDDEAIDDDDDDDDDDDGDGAEDEELKEEEDILDEEED